jgi:hypothetical protein
MEMKVKTIIHEHLTDRDCMQRSMNRILDHRFAHLCMGEITIPMKFNATYMYCH